MEMSQFAGVTGITVICYLLGLGVKLTPLSDRLIPLCCGLAGGLLGALAMLWMPGYPADNLIDALAVGIASGLAATGWDQLGKQLRE